MPRIAIMSDIHGNLEAFEAALAAVYAEGVEYLVQLGDLVGYNANPHECVDLAVQHHIIGVLGNHDLAIREPQIAARFNVMAHQALLYAKENLTPADCNYLSSLPRTEVLWDQCLLCHGTPESIEAYLANLFQAKRIFNLLRKHYAGIRVCFYGHTHVQKIWVCDERGKVQAPVAAGDTLILSPEHWYLINPGSVGQPRQQDNRAHYLIFDSEQRTAQFRTVAYDIAAAQRKILQARLPKYLAQRLADGI
jgi:predicted phosphodiesterase